jgi:hypothetical protein
MSEIDARQPASADKRQPWQPLDYDKIAAADAEAGFIGVGADNTIYS